MTARLVGYGILRFWLWFLGVGAAAVPALFQVSINPFDLAGDVAALNAIGAYRDLIYVIVIVSVLSLSALTDFIFRHYSNISDTAKLVTILAMMMFFISLLTGWTIFIMTSHQTPFTEFGAFWAGIVLLFTLGVGVIAELCTSTYNMRHG